MLISDRLGVVRPSGPRNVMFDSSDSFILATTIVVPFLWWFRRRIRPNTLYRLAVAVLLGGLLGNLADGWRVGYPVDYILVGIPINVADVAVLSGGSLLIYRLLLTTSSGES